MKFWQDVSEYGAAQSRDADRLLRLTQAWAIFNQYIALNAPHKIGISAMEREHLHCILLEAKDFVEVSLFNSAKQHTLTILEQSWIRYLKEDMKAFIEQVFL